MRDFLILTKALYKANYGMDLKSKQGRKGIITAIVLIICLLPTFALIFNMFLICLSLFFNVMDSTVCFSFRLLFF